MKRKLRIKNFLTNSLLVVFSIALSIIVAEGISRLIFDPIDYLKPYLSKNKAFAVLSLKDPVPFFKQTMILPAILAK